MGALSLPLSVHHGEPLDDHLAHTGSAGASSAECWTESLFGVTAANFGRTLENSGRTRRTLAWSTNRGDRTFALRVSARVEKREAVELFCSCGLLIVSTKKRAKNFVRGLRSFARTVAEIATGSAPYWLDQQQFGANRVSSVGRAAK